MLRLWDWFRPWRAMEMEESEAIEAGARALASLDQVDDDDSTAKDREATPDEYWQKLGADARDRLRRRALAVLRAAERPEVRGIRDE